jgi:ATP-dependent DNA helicase PIF1
MLSPKQPQINPSWPLEKRLWWAIEAISSQCDGARRLDGKGFSKYDRPIADRLQGLELGKWSNKVIDDAIHLVRKYRHQLELMDIKMDDIIGSMDAVVTIDDDDKPIATVTYELPGPIKVDKPLAYRKLEGITLPTMGATGQLEEVSDLMESQPQTTGTGPLPINKTIIVDDDVSGSGADVYCEFLTGSAGTGKTYTIRQRIADNPNYAILSSTTGISAINLGAITLNSLLGYYDTDSLEESMLKGYLEKRLRDIIENGYSNLVIDEVSMLDKRQLDMIYEGIRRVNERSEWHDKGKLGLVLTGDYCQLPPVKADWSFKADCWPKFEANTVRLTKCWRQSDVKFLEAINLIRSGNGRDGVRILRDIGIPFSIQSDKTFDGTTIMAKNDAVDSYNFIAHSRVNGQLTTVKNSRWGKLRKEWDNIPNELSLKVGAYVMLLVNDAPRFTYVNGDCGHIIDYEDESGMFGVRLVRNNSEVSIGRLTRFNHQKDAPRELGEDNRSLRMAYAYDPECDELPQSPAFDIKVRKWIVGAVTYWPIRLAYAITIHKSQSLSLPRLQMDVNSHFMGAPAMMYVGISRCSDPAGLKIVGTPEMMADKVKVHPEVLKYL